MNWERELELALSDASNFKPYAKGVKRETIVRAESTLGVPLPESFRVFLENYGGGLVQGYELNGLFDEAHQDPPLMDLDLFVGDIVAAHRINCQQPTWPADLLEIVNFDGEETFCFDTASGIDGEYLIVEVDNFRFDEARVVASNFVEFIRFLG